VVSGEPRQQLGDPFISHPDREPTADHAVTGVVEQPGEKRESITNFAHLGHRRARETLEQIDVRRPSALAKLLGQLRRSAPILDSLCEPASELARRARDHRRVRAQAS
jgi:hypothetical protein